MADGRGEDWRRILEELLVGDRTALATLNRLITTNLTRLRAYDFRDEWDDLRQEVLIAVIQNTRAGRLRDPAAFLAYVRVITRNKFIDRLKVQLQCPSHEPLAWEQVLERSPDSATDAATVRDIWAVAERLPTEERIVLDGVYRQGKTYEQVSRDTGIPLGTMKRRLRDGLAALRRWLVEDPREDAP